MYKLPSQVLSGDKWITPQYVTRLPDNATVPFAEDNTDYQKYLAWLAEGNEPLPADEVK